MSKSFEKYSQKTPKDKKSPKQIKEEKALELARKVRKIYDRLKEERIIEDNQEIIRLLSEIKKLERRGCYNFRTGKSFGLKLLNNFIYVLTSFLEF
jgi:hypothetical protein